MTLEAMAAIGETVGGLGVIASLLYLAAQIRHSAKTARTSTTQALLGMSTQLNIAIAGDIAPVIGKVRAGQPVDHEDAFRYFAFMMATFAQSWQAHYQHSQGMLDEEIFEAYERRTISFFAHPQARDFWRENEFRFSDSFREYVNRLVERS